MTTMRRLIEDSLQAIGIFDPNTALDGADASVALRYANRLLEAWNTESLLVYTYDNAIYSVIPGKQMYSIGPAGNIAGTPTVRPTRIEKAKLRLLNTNPVSEVELKIIDDLEWADISPKTLTSPMPTRLWNDNAFPEAHLTLWPCPTQAFEIELWTWIQNASHTLNSEVVFAPGYERAFVANLGVDLTVPFRRQLTPELSELARDSKAGLKRFNKVDTRANMDSAIVGARCGFNYLTGD